MLFIFPTKAWPDWQWTLINRKSSQNPLHRLHQINCSEKNHYLQSKTQYVHFTTIITVQFQNKFVIDKTYPNWGRVLLALKSFEHPQWNISKSFSVQTVDNFYAEFYWNQSLTDGWVGWSVARATCLTKLIAQCKEMNHLNCKENSAIVFYWETWQSKSTILVMFQPLAPYRTWPNISCNGKHCNIFHKFQKHS